MNRPLPDPTVGHLADGREILLFDVSEAPRPVLETDHRALAPRPDGPTTTVRRDPQTGDLVIVAPARQDRTYKPPKQMCPLCPDPEGLSSELPVHDYRVAVFENRFPSLFGVAEAAGPPENALRVESPGVGRCEVVCFSSDHDGAFAGLTQEHARLVVDVWAHRTAALLSRDDVAEVYCFENRGEEIGVTLPHPHGQIYAFPFTTPRTAALMREAQAHRASTGQDLFESILAAEVADGDRILIRTDHTTAFVPFAAKWPSEVHVYPNRHVRNLSELTAAEADDLARVYLAVLRGFDALYGTPLPYIASWHQYRTDAAEGYLHAELFSIRRSADKLKYLAGAESGRDAFITDKSPEAIAAELRKALE
ncbi:Galactose-1-phosphate uridylyltransferase OS=Tsukamurella paurometabola (strain ATCC 8368 / DSM/ CCUG 35730 / CIP 100753 / JCM 10117 / KCTC 9821 / NBRC 16120 / NCIMB 702349 / NCTC 13040) OX=521096 GN=Tpau_0996 PE=3 SV=1 [Tsukamurella paurometabola]|uniref:Galactose-1-phosphate uridylyltransferase n=1 Tax=Tsukamurella paurometabola (strain ATCC 8368 / DSM 20162 / CCUG 35730 / CIP 100753 / JCM 10117 / KCTC 9821 / NBRC 16120 / NCIMB 702349 / NCTC 13040) TaxID=521096 RepID=D5UV39_TSUPD|nr:galactose-1-phosphate uridylyltransferase [Tsukamurella paurometabola]ADG77629.1 galactose-1-phosphate uridylyltransferase [Tsukamurella paurometabola DSM 20162]SUP28012.1 Galactose-1-phosphate uridylyltransferase [Tsukamurella paurometabola]